MSHTFDLCIGAATFALVVAAAGACCPPPTTEVSLRSRPRLRSKHRLPAKRAALLQVADSQVSGPSPSVNQIDRALAALERARAARDGFDVRWRLGRACFLMTEVVTVRHQRLQLARRGLRSARVAARLRPKRVEGHYYVATNLGRIAEARGNLALLKPMIAAAQRARVIDERFDHAGPLVYLGKLYLTAPPWPVSIGNPQKAIKLLERAVGLAPRALTRVFLGEAYFENEQYKRAVEQLERALEQKSTLSPRWRREAEDYLRRAKDELPSS